MLATVGVASLDELFETIPEEVRFGGRLGLPEPAAEADVMGELAGLAGRNRATAELTSFLGGGIYETYVPAVVDAVTSRSEFLTSYTPYQAERSQGVLQAIFEYQTAICELTGLDVSNASMYDGATALAEAAILAAAATAAPRRQDRRVRGVHPETCRCWPPRPTGWAGAGGPGRRRRRSHGHGGAARRRRLRDRRRRDLAAELLRRHRRPRRGGARSPTTPAPCSSSSPIRWRSASWPRRARKAPTSPSARASRSATTRASAGRASASSPPARSSPGACRAASSARRSTPKAGAASCSRCRPASSTSAARARPRTSAPTTP